ncbi:MAG: hypothetical protein HC930_12870 [Hydrococcus sp. SU_1_0]|nr:hypothetical protein [Hydrococcus sp. SU_1_0]
MTYEGYQNRSLDIPLHPQHHTSVTTHYAVSKLYGENLGQMYANVHNLSVICIRLGWYPRADAHEESIRDSSSLLLSKADCQQLFTRCVEASNVRYTVVNGLSQGSAKQYDLELGRKVLNFYPQDSKEKTLEEHIKAFAINFSASQLS